MDDDDSIRIDQTRVLESGSRDSRSNDFMGPIDDLLALIQDVYAKKRKVSFKYVQFINSMAHEMKNRIINDILQ